jgi:hypothetical protein
MYYSSGPTITFPPSTKTVIIHSNSLGLALQVSYNSISHRRQQTHVTFRYGRTIIDLESEHRQEDTPIRFDLLQPIAHESRRSLLTPTINLVDVSIDMETYIIHVREPFGPEYGSKEIVNYVTSLDEIFMRK